MLSFVFFLILVLWFVIVRGSILIYIDFIFINLIQLCRFGFQLSTKSWFISVLCIQNKIFNDWRFFLRPILVHICNLNFLVRVFISLEVLIEQLLQMLLLVDFTASNSSSLFNLPSVEWILSVVYIWFRKRTFSFKFIFLGF